jgi:fibronectin-binding autotransporter adhesin
MTTYVVSSGRIAGGFPLSGGDVLEVLSGGLTDGNLVSSGGTELVYAGGTDLAVTTVFDGGLEDVFGVASGGTVLSGGRKWGPCDL